MDGTKRLYRSNREKMIAGVCGGLANYFGIDPTIVRLIFILLFFAPPSGILIYLIMWLITPLEPTM
jgi:phage shock protein C